MLFCILGTPIPPGVRVFKTVPDSMFTLFRVLDLVERESRSRLATYRQSMNDVNACLICGLVRIQH